MTPTFVYVGGNSALDLVNTVDWVGGGAANERLTTYPRLTEWAEGSGVISRGDAERYRALASRHPRQAIAALADARDTRALLKRIFHGVADGTAPDSVWRAFDRVLRNALGRLGVRRGSGAGFESAGGHWLWEGADHRLEAILWPVAWSAANLLTSDEVSAIRVCDGPDCGWVFVDRSRNGLRRWCQMHTCGTIAKTARRRGRANHDR